MNILVTGGAGYIGSHILIELFAAGHTAVVIDNFSNSSHEALKRVSNIVGASVPLYEGDVEDRSLLGSIFERHSVDAVVHLAGLKAVGESVAQPLKYYKTNLESSMALLEVMPQYNVKNLVFSSSATVYGTPQELPLTEESRVGEGLTNPYGKTKYMIEQMLEDVSKSDDSWNITVLRYFNPIGAHESGEIGEDPNDTPNNIMPYISQVAVGKRPSLNIFGDDYETPDGTGVRDYIHVVDLAKGHVAALVNKPNHEYSVYNLGTGKGVSVLDLVHAFEAASNVDIPYSIAPRREGDIACCYADPQKAEIELAWRAEKSLADACADSWRWQTKNPNGFSG